MQRNRWLLVAVALIIVAVLVIWLVARVGTAPQTAEGAYANVVVPAPVSAVTSGEQPFVLDAKTTIVSDSPIVAGYLAGILRKSTGYPLATAEPSASGAIVLSQHGAPASVGDEGYQMTISAGGVAIHANAPAGLFAGVQTLLQLLP